MTFSEYAKYYEDSILSMGKTSSIKTTRSRLRKALSEFGDRELPIPAMDLQRFITKLSLQYPPQTVRNCWGSMRTVLLRAKADGLITEVPRPILPKVFPEEQEWFTPDEMKKLVKYEVLYAVASETGARIGELLALKVGDVDLEARTLSIRRTMYDGVISVPKTRAGNRTISISGWLVSVLRRELNKPTDEFVFESRSVDAELARLHHACKIFGIKEKGFHAFRRGNATLQASVIGVPEKIIAYRLGHANLGITLGRYAKYMVGLDKDAAEKIGELLT